MAEGIACPYCGHLFDKPVVRKKKCPACGNVIFIRRGHPLTEEGAKEHDTIKHWLNALAPFQIDREAFDACRVRLSDRFGVKASVNDTVWSLLNSATSNQPADRAVAYLLMAEVVKGENKDPARFILEAKKVRGRENARRAAQWRADIQRNVVECFPVQLRVCIHTCNDHLVCEPCREAAIRT